MDKSSADIVKKIKSDYGKLVARSGSDGFADVSRLPSGILAFDIATGGGFPMGKVSVVYGPESCIDGDTRIQYAIRDQYGRIQNSKGGSIRNLWHRFHGVPRPGQGNYQREVTRDSEFVTSCMNDDGRIFRNLIVDVVKTGVKPCFTIVTEKGLSLTATAEHKFFVGSGYLPLSDLSVGDTLFIHNNTPYKVQCAPAREWRKYLFVNHHPVAGIKLVEGGKYVYHRLANSRAVVEAALNDMTLAEYVERLNSGDLAGLQFLPRELHVHHKNEDIHDDSLDNLEIIDAGEHGRIHATERHNNLRFMVVEDKIASITPVGDRETYDIRMESPFNNYVANGIVVHNSGKTNLVYKAIAEGQTIYPDKMAVFVDAEHGYDPSWASALGVDTDRLIVISPEYAEQAVDIIEAFLYASDVFCIALDSIAALSSQNEISNSAEKASVGGASLVVGRLLKKATVAFNRMSNQGLTPPAFIAVNQIRHKIGAMYDPETMPGGFAVKFASSFTVRMYGKNITDQKIHPVLPVLKETNIIIKKWKMPIVAANAVYSIQMIEANGRKPGFIDDWNTMKTYMVEYGFLVKKSPTCWIFLGEEFKTLTSIKDLLYSDHDLLMKVRGQIIQSCLSASLSPVSTDEEPQQDE